MHFDDNVHFDCGDAHHDINKDDNCFSASMALTAQLIGLREEDSGQLRKLTWAHSGEASRWGAVHGQSLTDHTQNSRLPFQGAQISGTYVARHAPPASYQVKAWRWSAQLRGDLCTAKNKRKQAAEGR
jgi:hypothetical protein